MSIAEEQLERWAKAPSETEETKCQNAVSRISGAIKGKFGNDVSIFLQGSYKNRTNVRQDSDVDIVVLHNNFYFPEVSSLQEDDKQIYWNDFQPSEYTFAQFKNEIQQVMESEFDYGEVERRNKCIRIKKNSYRVDADVVPCFVHKRLRGLDSIEAEGVEFRSDDDKSVYNFPEHHYQNGIEKNQETKTNYKAIIRILKNVRNELIDGGKIDKDAMPSFFLECLVWNVLPNDHFHKNTYFEITRAVIATIWNDMLDPEKANNYSEVNDLKWLFRGNAHRTPTQVKNFMQQAWDFIGYEN